jgi:excisionase family DNA binding protein
MDEKVELTDEGWVFTLQAKANYYIGEASHLIGTTSSSVLHYIRRDGLPCKVVKATSGKGRESKLIPHDGLVEWMNYRKEHPGFHDVPSRFATPVGDTWVYVLPTSEYYTVQEASRILGVSASRLYTWRRTGELSFVRIVQKGRIQRKGILHVEHDELVRYIQYRESRRNRFDPESPGGFEVLTDDLSHF